MDAVVALRQTADRRPGPHRRQSTAVGLDETLFCRAGPVPAPAWSTQIVDVARGQLLDVVPGRDAAEPCAWFAAAARGVAGRIRWATLDLSGPYRAVFDTMLPDAVQVADPFHVVKLANTDARRVPPAGAERDVRSSGPQDRSALPGPPAADHGRTNASTDDRDAKLLGLLAAGDPDGEVRTAWHAKEVVRRSTTTTTPSSLPSSSTQLGRRPPRRVLPARGPPTRPHHHALAAPDRRLAPSHVTNGPTEAINNLDQADQARRVRDHPLAATTASEPCSTPADPTGHSSTPHPTLKSEAPVMRGSSALV